MPRREIALAAALIFGVALQARPALAEPGPEEVARALARARTLEQDLVETVRRIRRSSVSVVSRRPAAERREGPRRPLPLEGVGSGVAIAWGGGTWVLTNYHVVDNSRYTEAIGIDGVRHRLRLHAFDAKADLAVLAFEVPPTGLLAASVEGRALPDLAEGRWVVATGNPFFLALDGSGAASLGVVSGVRAADSEAYVDSPTLQHDAEINPGSSGGPLWTAHGDLAGINGTIATRARSQGAGPSHTGASFAIPIGAIQRFLAAKLGGTASVRPTSPAPAPTPRAAAARPTPAPGGVPPARQGYLGIQYRTVRDRSGRPAGARVEQVRAGSPAHARRGGAGLQPGDLITRVGARGRTWSVRSAHDVQSALAGLGVGTSVSLEFVRQGRRLAWSGRLAVR